MNASTSVWTRLLKKRKLMHVLPLERHNGQCRINLITQSSLQEDRAFASPGAPFKAIILSKSELTPTQPGIICTAQQV